MIHAMYNRAFDLLERPAMQAASRGNSDFAELFGNAAKPSSKASSRATEQNELFSGPDATPLKTPPPTSGDPEIGEPDIQSWLNSYYRGATTISYEAAPGAPENYTPNDAYGPDAIFAQAFDNQAGNNFAAMTGLNAAALTAQLPGIPTVEAQQTYDQMLASSNAERLATGQPIDTAAYWSNPGSVTMNGVTYTAQELGYAGPGQSSGPEPIYLSANDQIQGSNTFFVPGYQGTVTGLTPGRYYTLQQMEAAGLPTGQQANQFTPGSWTETRSS